MITRFDLPGGAEKSGFCNTNELAAEAIDCLLEGQKWFASWPNMARCEKPFKAFLDRPPYL